MKPITSTTSTYEVSPDLTMKITWDPDDTESPFITIAGGQIRPMSCMVHVKDFQEIINILREEGLVK